MLYIFSVLVYFCFNYMATAFNIGQKPWVSKRCIQDSHSLMNRGMLFSPKGKEELSGCCANSVHNVTLFKLL